MKDHPGYFAVDSVKLSIPQFRAAVVSIAVDEDLIGRMTSTLLGKVTPELIKVMEKHSTILNVGMDNIVESDVITRFSEARMPYYEQVQDTLTTDVLKVLEDTVAKGESLEYATDKLTALRSDFTEGRTNRIARREISQARKEGTLEFGMANKHILEKEWRSTPGVVPTGRTRKSHHAMNKVRIPMDQKFQVPYGMDDNPPTTEVIEENVPGESVRGMGCRCQLILKRKDS